MKRIRVGIIRAFLSKRPKDAAKAKRPEAAAQARRPEAAVKPSGPQLPPRLIGTETLPGFKNNTGSGLPKGRTSDNSNTRW